MLMLELHYRRVGVIDMTTKPSYNGGALRRICTSGWPVLRRGMEMREAISTAAKIPVLTRIRAQDPFLMRPHLLPRV
jgi:hypothetical protein